MKYRLQIKDEKAMTIAEILVSVFILALIAAVILPGLLFGYNQVHQSGSKSAKISAVQKELEGDLINPGADAVPAALKIQFGSEIFEVKGKIVQKEEAYDANGSKTKAKVFIPQD